MLGSLPRVSAKCLRSCQSLYATRQPRIDSNSRRVSAMVVPQGDTFYLDSFAMRQWDDPHYPGTRLTFDKEEFVTKVHEFYHGGSGLVDGYAPFCKHIFVPNFVGAKVGSVAITVENQQSILTAYESRRPEELPVLARWIPSTKVEVPEAKMLDIILYSREQILKEKESLPSEDKLDEIPDVPWGIISIKAQDEDFETPMQPITMMRNALGKEEGGSGVPLDKETYMKSVNYWRHRVPVLERD